MKKKPKQYLIGDRLTSKEEREDEIFSQSTGYSVAVLRGLGTRSRQDYKTFPEAMVACLYTEGGLVYAWNDAGNCIQIPRDQYPHFLELYNKLTGSNLRMHPKFYELKLNPLSKG